MKKIVIVFITLLVPLLIIVFLRENSPLIEYTVRITFCDSRPSRVVIYEGRYEEKINTGQVNYPVAVPIFLGYYNVCEVEILNKKLIK